MRRLVRRKGQSTLEYAVVTAVVIGALVFVGWGWFRGAYQKRIMGAGDDISGGGQFDILHTSIATNQTRNSNTTDTMTGTASGAAFSSNTSERLDSSVNADTADLQTRRGAR